MYRVSSAVVKKSTASKARLELYEDANPKMTSTSSTYTDKGDVAMIAWDLPGSLNNPQDEFHNAEEEINQDEEESDDDLEYGTCGNCGGTGELGTLCMNCLDSGMIYTEDAVRADGSTRDVTARTKEQKLCVIRTNVIQGILTSNIVNEMDVFFKTLFELLSEQP